MTAVVSFCCLCILLVVGKILRMRFTIFQRLYLPSSVIGGAVGLLIASFGGNRLPPDWHAGWNQIPAFLINIVFAALFLGITTPGFKKIWRVAAPQFCYGQIVAWGQYVVGTLLVILLLKPLFGVNSAFGALIEVGFEGGHGTVAGLSNTFRELNWPEGKDLGFTVATVGMISGVVIGMWLINLAVRFGWVKNIRSFADQSPAERRGLHPADAQPSAGKQTVSADSIDSLALHTAIIGLAVTIGFVIKELLALLNHISPPAIQDLKFLESFPLFPLCMIGGLLLQKMFTVCKIDYLIDHGLMQRLAGTALDFLVVAAVASIQLEFVAAYWQPLAILSAAGIAWNVFGILYLAPRILPDAWFERGIAEFGQSTGVTATGLLLLRTVDPESKTVAAEAFGYKQLLHEPIMGGGIWTSLAVPLLICHGSTLVLTISAAAVGGWLLFWKLYLSRTGNT
ncbi:sodium/glutamate symporter [Victivallis sp. Marseille-Q1083]|uniref:sodium/glutamate symporter n=1 Tax=Victivallis sp. Marseille-Q1083 TaxID=2717288 RepID=UPI00158C7550|nr:sodium/glutamate symporter [Victivallis sp. Marseille-Q1083]